MNDNARMVEYIATAKRGTNMELGLFNINLSELWYQWWSNSVVGTCEDMPREEMIAWFLQEVTIELNNILDEEK